MLVFDYVVGCSDIAVVVVCFRKKFVYTVFRETSKHTCFHSP